MNEEKTNQRCKWWGWGDENKTFSLEERPNFLPYLNKEIELTEDDEEASSRVELNSIELPACKIKINVLEKLKKTAGESNVFTDDFERVVHSYGKSYPDLVRIRKGIIPNPPDIIVYPENEKHISEILQIANENDIIVIPFGGGTGVVGGVEPCSDRQVISLDMTKMNDLLSMDQPSLTATLMTGIYGPELEKKLNTHGYTLYHFPQSFEFSTLGGWIATRSAGQQSTKFGKIEDMVVSLKMISPTGEIKLKELPANATGPDLKQIIIGSEGILGIISCATVKIHKLPEYKDYRGIYFKDYEMAVEAVKNILQSDIMPCSLRLSDIDETIASFKLKTKGDSMLGYLTEKFGKWYLTQKGYSYDSGCMLILGFEGDKKNVEHERLNALNICTEYGSFDLGTKAGDEWYKTRFELPYLRDVLLDKGLMVDTLETATMWNNINNLYYKLKDTISRAICDTGVKGLVYCHISHVYEQGASLYLTFLGKQVKGEELEQWQAVKKAATDCISQNGGALSHHHGIGKQHALWMKNEITLQGLNIIKGVKRVLDPNNIMNPGKLVYSDMP